MCTIHFHRVTPSPSFFLVSLLWFFISDIRSVYGMLHPNLRALVVLLCEFKFFIFIFLGGHSQQFPHYITGKCVCVCTQVCMSVCAHMCEYVHVCECMFCSSRWGAVVFPWVMLACLHLKTFQSLTPGLRLYVEEGMPWSTLLPAAWHPYLKVLMKMMQTGLALLPGCFRARWGDFQPLLKPDN